MTFIVLMAALIFNRFFDYHKSYRTFNWFTVWQNWLANKWFVDTEKSWIFTLVSLALPLWGFDLIIGFIFGFNFIVTTLVSIGILLITIGPLDFENSVDDYIQAKSKNDDELSKHYAERLIFNDNPALNETEEVQVTRSLLYCSVEHFFAVIFWFILLGPIAALFYRVILQNYLNNRESSLAKLVLAYVIFIPAHLVSFSFALVGSFEETINKLKNMNEYSNDLLSKCRQLTVASGCAALSLNTSVAEYLDGNNNTQFLVENARAIILRTLVVWLSVVLIVVLSQLSNF